MQGRSVTDVTTLMCACRQFEGAPGVWPGRSHATDDRPRRFGLRRLRDQLQLVGPEVAADAQAARTGRPFIGAAPALVQREDAMIAVPAIVVDGRHLDAAVLFGGMVGPTSVAGAV